MILKFFFIFLLSFVYTGSSYSKPINVSTTLVNILNHRKTGIPQKKDATDFLKIENNIYLKKITFSRPLSLEDIKLCILRVNKKELRRLVLIHDRSISDITQICKKNNLLFAINSCFFDHQKKPLGILHNKNKRFSFLKRGNLPVFYATNSKAEITSSKKFQNYFLTNEKLADSLLFAFQTWPQILPHLSSNELKQYNARRRSMVGIDNKGHLYFIWTDSIFSGFTFNEIRQIISNEKIPLISLVNMDGGKSTQAYIETKNYKIHTRGLDKVPAFIGIKKH